MDKWVIGVRQVNESSVFGKWISRWWSENGNTIGTNLTTNDTEEGQMRRDGVLFMENVRLENSKNLFNESVQSMDCSPGKRTK